MCLHMKKTKHCSKGENHNHQKAFGHQIDLKNQHFDELTQNESETYGLDFSSKHMDLKGKENLGNVFWVSSNSKCLKNNLKQLVESNALGFSQFLGYLLSKFIVLALH